MRAGSATQTYMRTKIYQPFGQGRGQKAAMLKGKKKFLEKPFCLAQTGYKTRAKIFDLLLVQLGGV